MVPHGKSVVTLEKMEIKDKNLRWERNQLRREDNNKVLLKEEFIGLKRVY